MNIAEMHIWFRQYAQQMGMQNVRAILPEQIDVLINTSISDIVNQLVRSNVGIRDGRAQSDTTKLNQINALRPLYKVVELDMATETPFMEFNANDVLTGKMSNKYDNNGILEDVSTTVLPEHLYIVDFSINYKTTKTGFTGTHVGAIPLDLDVNHVVTSYFPVRLIDDAYFADTINDFILKSRITDPIIVLYNDDTFDLYIDKFRTQEYLDTNYYVLKNKLIPYKLRVSYIAIPNKVRYATDINGTNVDCDLPESMHVDILKHAVDLYDISIRGGLYNSSQSQQPASNEAQATGGYQN